MKKYSLMMLLFGLNAMADPFFGENNKNEDQAITESNPHFVKNIQNSTACSPPEHPYLVNLPFEFEKLKLVGLARINNQFKALFIDDKNQILDITENMLINSEIEIKNINLKSFTYINWKLTKDCKKPYEITFKL